MLWSSSESRDARAGNSAPNVSPKNKKARAAETRLSLAGRKPRRKKTMPRKVRLPRGIRFYAHGLAIYATSKDGTPIRERLRGATLATAKKRLARLIAD